MPTADLKQYHQLELINTELIFSPLLGDIPVPAPPPPGPSLDKDQTILVPQNVAKWVTYKGKNLDQVKKVLFDKESLDYTCNKDGSAISIRLTRGVTSKPGTDDELDLISDDNDPVHAPFTVTPATTQKAGK